MHSISKGDFQSAVEKRLPGKDVRVKMDGLYVDGEKLETPAEDDPFWEDFEHPENVDELAECVEQLWKNR